MSSRFDVAIAGLGAVGSAAACFCTAHGLSVVGFDRFAPPHSKGSSHGGSRIIRRAYFEGSMYVPLLNRGYELWSHVEDVSGRKLVSLIGGLNIGPSDGEVARGSMETASMYGIPHEVLNPQEVRERFPAFHLADDEMAVWEPEAGWVHPENAIETHLALAAGRGASLHMDEPVLEWIADGSGVRVTTDRGTYSVGKLILSAGGWISTLAGTPLSLTVSRQVNVWYAADSEELMPDRCPVYLWEYEPGQVLYGFPDLGEGVKAGLHTPGTPAASPDEIERVVRKEDVSALTQKLRRLLPGCGAVLRTATCVYTNTPDSHYLIDRHPEYEQVIIASACSGHGFKASNAVGEVVSDLAAGQDARVDVSAFRLRF